ncbi:MAG: carboxymuconolactone decarboxylase family protein [Candidatus Thiodiazotropha endolucinida]
MLPKSIKPRFFDALSNMTGRYVQPAPYHKAEGLVKKVYDQVIDEFFINAPMTTHAVSPELLAGLWMAEREIVLTDNHLSREDKEALGVTISQVNSCAYCEDLMNSVVYGANEQELAEQMRYHKQDEITDERTRLLHAWAQSLYDQDAEILYQPPFTPDEAPEVIGVAMMLSYFNRYAQVFFSGSPLATPISSTTLKSILYRLTGFELRESVLRRLRPGRSINLLGPADLPKDLQWASGNSTISAAMSRWASAVEEAASAHVPQRVREVVKNEIKSWRGTPMGLSRAWLTPKTTGLNQANAAAVRLALLTALSPEQMSDDIIDAYKEHYNDTALVVTVSWSAFMASKRVTGWLADKTGYFEQHQFAVAS